MGTKKSVIMAMLAVMLLAFGSIAMAEDYKAVTIGNYDNVTVMEFTGNYDTPTTDDPADAIPRQVIANEFYKSHKDDYDFLVIFSNFDFQMPVLTGSGKQIVAEGFYMHIKNDTDGIGKEKFDFSNEFGSKGKLQGTIDMGYTGKKAMDPLDPGFEQTMTTLSHELLHRWSAYVKFKKWDGSISKDLLGSDEAHWSFLLDTKGSMQYGNLWTDNGDGTFTSLPGWKYYSPLDLYLMGLIPKEQIQPMLLIENPEINKEQLPQPGLTINGTSHYVTIDGIIEAAGERMPNTALSQKSFKIGCIYLTRPGTFEGRDEVYPLRNVLKNWTIWFSSLTKGKAMVKIDTAPNESIPINPGVTPPPYDERTAPPSIQDGLAWLLNAQKEDGSWQDSNQTTEKDTAETALTLMNFPEANSNVETGMDWLSGVTRNNTDYLARKIEAFVKARENPSDLIPLLLARRNSDGGWGSQLDYESNPADTAWALRVLSVLESKDDNLIQPAIAYLLKNQNPDSGWGKSGNISAVQATVNVLYAFIRFQKQYALSDAIQKGLAWLFSRQNEDGGFGNSPSTVYDTALALSVLKSFCVTPDMTDKALGYILSFQDANGGWYASPYQTALAINALYLWNDAISTDLAVNAEKIVFTPGAVDNPPQIITVRAEVRNLGMISANQVKVALYDGSINEANKKGEQTIDFPARTTEVLSFELEINDAKAHEIFIVADPENLIKEAREDNNIASQTLENHTCMKPDLAISAGDIVLAPENIMTIPQEMTIQVKASNKGRVDADNSIIALYDGEISGANKIGEKTISIPAGGSTNLTFTCTIQDGRTHLLYVAADPDNQVDECIETNNKAVKALSPKTTYDFQAMGLTVAPMTLNMMETVSITSRINNKGTSDVYDVAVRYYIDRQTGPYEIALANINIPAGKTVEHNVTWKADLAGENMALTVQADPSDVFKELSEGNNSIATLITVKQYTQPNLAVRYQDITISPAPALEGGSAVIGAPISNKGFSIAENVGVEFYEGLSDSDKKLIGTQTIPSLAPSQSVTVTMNWGPILNSGKRYITVVVDPQKQIEEFDETDNSAFIELDILSLPDLAIATNSISFNPEAPKEGEEVTIQVSVQNFGQQEALNVPVQVKEGANVIGVGTISRIAGLSIGNTNFQYNTQGKPGGHRIDVTVDPQSLILEKSKENNSASRSFGVQNADLWLSEPYISPNGDGIKDSTQFFFRLKQAQTVQVVVANPKGKVVRAFTGDEFKNTSGNAVTWNGLDEQGRVVLDGQYQFQVRSTRNSTVLAMLPVIVDNNRSSLTEAIGTKYLFQNNLTCVLPDLSWWQWLPNESGIVFLIGQADPNTPGYNEGIYTVSPDGEDIKRIVPAEWCENNGTDYAYYYNNIDVSSDGEKIVFNIRKQNKKTGRDLTSEIWSTDRYGEHLRLILSSDLVNTNNGYFYNLTLSPDGNYLSYLNEKRNWDCFVGLIKTDGSGGNVQMPLSWRWFKSKWSPDSITIALLEEYSTTLKYLDIDGRTGILFENYYISFFDWLKKDQLIVGTGREIYLIDAAGSANPKMIVEESAGSISDYKINSQDHSIAYIGGGYGGAPDDTWNVGICEDQGACKTIHTTPAENYHPSIYDLAWSQDGKKLAFFDQTYEKVADCDYNGYLVAFDKTNATKQVFQVSSHENPCGGGEGYGYGIQDTPDAEYYGSLQWFQDNEYLLAEDSSGFFGVSTEDGQKSYFPVTKQNIDQLNPSLSPYGRYITYNQGVDERSICYGKGNTDVWLIGSLLNLTADLKVIKNKNSITLKGTAADLHFESYRLQYAEMNKPTDWKPIIPPADQMVVNNTFLEWVPPSEGIFLVRLVVQDKAGNVAWDRKRVSWGQFTFINDLKQSEKIFSPNGDMIKDTVELTYQVAAPVHLQFFIYNEEGRLVRTNDRNYDEPQPGSMIWDGTDEHGIIVPDGDYKIKVLDYEFEVEVDTVAPMTALKLEEETVVGSFDSQVGPVDMHFRLEGLAWDKNLKEWTIEYGQGENPPEWYSFRTGTDPLMEQNAEEQPLLKEIESFRNDLFDFPIDKRFRITVSDSAGNQVMISNDLIEWEQEIFISEWDSQKILYNMNDKTVEVADDQDLTMLLKPGRHVIRGIENIRQPLRAVDLQYYQDKEWRNPEIMVNNDSGHVELVWDNALIPISDLEKIQMVRLRVVDSNEMEYFSLALPVGESKFILEGSSSCGIPLLKGEISIVEDLKFLHVQVRSDNDPNYNEWTDFWNKEVSKGDTLPSGKFKINPLPLLQHGGQYFFRMLGLSLSDKEYHSKEISSQLFQPTFCFDLKVTYPEVGCNALSGQAKLNPDIKQGSKPIKINGISYYILEEESWKPLAQAPFLDTSGWPEKTYPVKAILQFQEYDSDSKEMEVREQEATANVMVNRVLPTAEIIYPQNGVSICPKFNKQDSLTWYTLNVEGLADDDQEGNRYALYYKIGEKPIWHEAETCRPVLENGVLKLECSPINGGTLHGKTALWNVTDLIGVSDLWLKLESIDATGNKSCRVISAKIATQPNIKVTSAPALFSPNLDGVLDETHVTFSLDQDSKLNLQVFKISESEPVKSFFISELKPAGTYSIAWDGTDDNGQRVANGRYEIRAGIPNVCDDSLVETAAAIEIDNTPPSIEVTYPQTDSRPGLMLEVKGTVDDPHFDFYQLVVPELNILIGSGDKAKINTVLGRWNRYGLNGRYTLKFNAEDTLGNKSEKIVDVQLDAIPDFIKSLGAEPEIFSPNGDAKLETLSVAYDLSTAFVEGFNVSLQVLQGQTIVRTYSPAGVLLGGSYQWSWDGKNDGNVSMPDGVYSLLLTAKLASDNNLEQKEAVTFELDRTTPAIDLQTPQEGAYLKDPNINFLGSITDKNLSQYELNLQGDGQAWLLDKGQQSRVDYSFAKLKNLPDSPYTLSVKAEDAARIVIEKKINFTVDRTPPKIILTAPSENELFGNQKQIIGVKAQIEEKNPAQWALRYGRGEKPDTWTDLISGTTLPAPVDPYNWSVNAQSGVSDGLYTIMLYAKDKAGWEADAKVKVIVDNTPPVAIITVPAENGYVTKAMDIQGTAFDDNLMEYTLEISASDCNVADKWTLLKKETKSVQDGTLALFSALPPDGSYCLRLKAVDKVGYESETKKGIIIDTAPPAAPVLSGKVQNKADALLTWTANSEPDLDGYNLYRDNQKINTILIKETQYRDQDLKEGIYNYIVKAVDKAGLESDPSNSVSLKIDLTPPLARIALPKDNTSISDIVKIKGTAYSDEDFKEYRVYTGQGTTPSAWQLLLRSPVPVPYGELADWDTIALTEGSYTIKLEAEDLSGNTNVHQIAVSVDNTPTGPPNLSKADSQGSNVDLAWDWGANQEPDDVIGYLLYCNYELANVTGNVIGDLKPYLINVKTYTDMDLPDGKFTYYVMAMDEAGNISEQSNSRDVNIDTHAPKVVITVPKDGHRFETTIMVKGETPDLDIAQVQFQYQKPGETIWNDLNSPVVNLPYITYLDPKALNLAYGTYRLRAIGTDFGGRTDEAPAEITVYYTDTTAPLNPIELDARADEGQVILNWKPNSEEDLSGYNIYKVAESTKTKLNGVIISGTTTYIHGGSGNDALADAEYVYEITALDTFGNESKPSNQVKALVYTPLLEQPCTPSGVSPIQVTGTQAKPNDAIEIYISANDEPGTLQSKASADDQGKFTFHTPLPFEPTWIRVQASDKQGNRSKKSAPVVVLYNEPPAAPTGLQGTAQDHTVHLTWNANSEADLAGYFLYRDKQKINQPSAITTGTASASYDNNHAKNAFDKNTYSSWCCYLGSGSPQWWQLALPTPELIEKIELSWWDTPYVPQDYDIQIWTGQIWLTLRQIKDNQEEFNTFEFKPGFRTQKIRIVITRPGIGSYYNACLYEVGLYKANPVNVLPQPLFNDPDRPDGKYAYQVSAVDMYGAESLLSSEVVVPVGDVIPPAAPIQLIATPDQADVNLIWTANTEPDLSGYHIYKKNSQGWVKINSALVSNNTYKDVGLANGTYTYRVTALDQIGNESEPSNETSAVINIGVPQQPINLQITAIPEGQALRICWEYNGGPVAGFNLYRALQPGGPYVRVNQELLKDTCYLDEGLVNGVKYYYYVTAVDQFGNEGQSSPEQYATAQDIVSPDPPVIFYPTLSGIPLEVEKADQTLIGFAEPESLVELFKDGNSFGKIIALKSAEEQTYALSSDTWEMAVSPDGRKIAFIENSHLFLRDLDTNQAVTLANSYTYDMRWLPDQKRLSFTAQDENGNYRIFIYNVSTGEKTRLTDDNDGDWEYSSSWSRNGKYAAFISNRDGNSKVWIKDLVSGEMKSMADSNEASYPEISADGSKVVYFKENSLYLADVITGASLVIDSAAYRPNEYGSYGWSPDDRALAFISYRNGPNDLFIRDIQNGEVRQVTHFQDLGLPLLGFKWSPDGKTLLCLTQKENEYILWTITAGGALNKPKLLKQWSTGYIQTIDWVSKGQVVYDHYVDGVQNELGLIQPPGLFAFDTMLNLGDNVFTATARDAAGNLSGFSEPVTLVLPEQVLPDLAITTDTIFVYPAAPIIGDQIRIYAVVENKGLADAEGFNADIYLRNSQDQWVLLKQESIDRIVAGSSLAIPISLEAAAYPGSNTLMVFVDAENRVYELSENNNFAQRDFYVATQEGIEMTTVLDAQEYQVESDLSIHIAVNNSGPACDLELGVQIEDENGAAVHVFDPMALNLAYGTGKDIDLQWNTGLTYAGHYRVRAVLKEEGEVILENLTPFKIAPEIAVSAQLSTDKLHYAAMEEVLLDIIFMNQGRNSDIPHLDVSVSILHEGVQVFNNAFGLDNLPADSSVNLSAVWNSGLSAAGTYEAQVEFLLEGQVIANSAADFFIDPEIKLSGTLKAVPISVYFNRPVKAEFTIHNKGNTSLDELAVKVLLLDPDTQKVLDSQEQTVTMDSNGSGTGQCEFSTFGFSLKSYKLLLQAEYQESMQTLATAVFNIKDGVAPAIAILSPPDQSSQSAPFNLLVQVSDDASGVNQVEYRLDQETQWRLLPPVDPATSKYGTKWIPKEAEEGLHTIYFRASDRAGNVSDPVSTSIRIVPRVDMTMSLNAEQYGMNEDSAIKVNLTNIAWAKGVTLKVNILNNDGVVLHGFDPVQAALAADESREFVFTWNTGLNPAGPYKAQAVLTKGDLNLVEKTAAFSIRPVLTFSSSLTTDKTHYGLKENTALNLSVTNTGNTAAPLLNLKLKIRPEGGQDLFAKDLSVTDLSPNVPAQLAETWNTAQYPAGNYQARLEVYLNNELTCFSETGFTIDPVPIVTGTLEIEPLKVAQGENYQAHYTVRNEGNVLLQNMPVKVLVNDSNQIKIAEQQESISLEINESKTGVFTFNSQAYSLGMYQTILQAAWENAGYDLDRKAFEIIDMTQPFEKLTGTIQATPNPVYLGQEESFQYTVLNEAGQALGDLTVKILVIDPDTQETKITLSETINLAGNSIHTGTLKASTSSLALKTYGAVLKVEMSGKEPRKLAETAFEVIAALDATKNLADETRLLVWVNDNCPSSCRPKEHGVFKDGLAELYSEAGCHSGLQKEISTSEPPQSQDKLHCDPKPCKECLDLNLLKVVLEQVADHYKIVFSSCAFGEEMRNPFYTDILILGDHQPLPDHMAAELREKVYSGTGLISSQWLKHGCSADYDDVFGITYKGVLSDSDPLIETVQSPVTTPGIFKTIGKAYKIQTDPDTLIAGWIKTDSKWKHWDDRDKIMCPPPDPQGPYAALVLHDYGQGRAIYQTFDLGRSLNETNREWVRALLENSLNYVHKAHASNEFAPYELAPIRLSLKSMGSALIARINESFPKEFSLYDPITKQWIDESPWVFDTSLDANGGKEIPFYYLTPDKAGTFQTQTDIRMILNDEPIPVKQLQLDLAVARDLDLILDEVINNLMALSLSHHDRAGVKNALAALNKVKEKKAYTQNDVDDIIKELLKAVDYLRSVESADMSNDRLELDRLMRSYGALYYLFVPAGEYLHGEVEASPNPVKANREVNFHVKVFNDGNEAFRDLIIKVLIVNPNTGQVVKTLEKPLILEGNSSQELDIKTVLKHFKAKTYKVQLKAYSGLLLEPKVLAEGNLKVTAQ